VLPGAAGSPQLFAGVEGCWDVNATCRCVSKDDELSALPAASALAVAACPAAHPPDAPPKARVGGRSARIVARVLQTTLEVLGREGFGRLRIEDVASRAGVNKTTIYRRWPTRADLVVAALTTMAGPPRAAEARRLEADLVSLFMSATTLRATAAGRGIVSALIAERGDPEVDRVCRELREMHRRPARSLLERARTRGELPGRADLDLLLDVLTGAVYGRLRECPEPLDPDWVRRVVRLVLSGVGAPGGRSTSRPRGSLRS
jgi:AcrR family transcriptional regulator